VSKNILVLGGSGYIGSHAVLEIERRGDNPVIYDNLSTGARELTRGRNIVEADIAEEAVLKETLSGEKIDAVMHFAASALVGESVEDPLKYYDNNVSRAVTLLRAMRETGVNDIIFSSTAATYGTPENTPIKETDRTAPINPYGRSKLMIEKILADCSAAYGLNYVVFRYFNAAGADKSAEIGEMHNPETHLIPLVLQAALGQRESIKILGTDYNTPDGTCVRDYIHVTDLIAAHLKAIEYLASGGKRTVFNLGNGNGFSVREIIDAAREVTGIDIPAEEAPRRPGDPDTLVASAEKAKKVLGWEPQIPHPKDIIQTAWNWHNK